MYHQSVSFALHDAEVFVYKTDPVSLIKYSDLVQENIHVVFPVFSFSFFCKHPNLLI